MGRELGRCVSVSWRTKLKSGVPLKAAECPVYPRAPATLWVIHSFLNSRIPKSIWRRHGKTTKPKCK